MTEEPGSAAASRMVVKSANIQRVRICKFNSLKFHLQAVVRKFNRVGKFRLRFVMVVVMSEVRKASAGRADTPRRGECLIQTHMSWMGRIAQSIEDRDFHAAASFHGFLWNKL